MTDSTHDIERFPRDPRGAPRRGDASNGAHRSAATRPARRGRDASTMTALTWLFLWCASGALVGWAIGTRTGHRRAGWLLGLFMGVFGWVLVLGAQPGHRASAPTVEPRAEQLSASLLESPS